MDFWRAAVGAPRPRERDSADGSEFGRTGLVLLYLRGGLPAAQVGEITQEITQVMLSQIAEGEGGDFPVISALFVCSGLLVKAAPGEGGPH